MSDTMAEGVIAKWHKKVGDQVKAGELMAEIETDKQPWIMNPLTRVLCFT